MFENDKQLSVFQLDFISYKKVFLYYWAWPVVLTFISFTSKKGTDWRPPETNLKQSETKLEPHVGPT